MPNSVPSGTKKSLQLYLVVREIFANQDKHIQKHRFTNLFDYIHTILNESHFCRTTNKGIAEEINSFNHKGFRKPNQGIDTKCLLKDIIE